MNKRDIKDSMDYIKPDSFMKARLKTKIDAHAHIRASTPRKLAWSTVAACMAVIAFGIGFGINMHSTDIDTVKLSTNQANMGTQNKNANDYTPDTTERTIYSQSEIEEDLGYTLPVVQADPNNNSVAVSTPFTAPVITGTRLIVQGKDISEGNHPHFYKVKNYVELPFMAILSELADTEIIWLSETKAQVIIDGISYTLNLDNQCTFVKDGTTENIFTPSPYVGDAPYYKVVDGELIIDNTTLAGLINYLGHVMVVDYDAKTVTIV